MCMNLYNIARAFPGYWCTVWTSDSKRSVYELAVNIGKGKRVTVLCIAVLHVGSWFSNLIDPIDLFNKIAPDVNWNWKYSLGYPTALCKIVLSNQLMTRL